jgi:hypothetical protein
MRGRRPIVASTPQVLAGRRVFVQNLRRGHYELAADVAARHRIRYAFDQLATAV